MGLKNLQEDIDYDLKKKVNELIGKAESIRKNLDALILKLKEEGAEANFNSLGELQGDGSCLDRLCGELDTLRRVKHSLQNIE